MWIDSQVFKSRQTPWISDNRGVSSLLIALVGTRAKGSLFMSEEGLILFLWLCQQHCLLQQASGGSFFITYLCMDWVYFGEEWYQGLVFGWVLSCTVKLAKPQKLSEPDDSLQ